MASPGSGRACEVTRKRGRWWIASRIAAILPPHERSGPREKEPGLVGLPVEVPETLSVGSFGWLLKL